MKINSQGNWKLNTLGGMAIGAFLLVAGMRAGGNRAVAATPFTPAQATANISPDRIITGPPAPGTIVVEPDGRKVLLSPHGFDTAECRKMLEEADDGLEHAPSGKSSCDEYEELIKHGRPLSPMIGAGK
jgi:hypothetical protein